jgi:hypothetical protein
VAITIIMPPEPEAAVLLRSMLTHRCQHEETRREGDRAVATIGTRRPNILLLGTTSYVWLRGLTEGGQSAIRGLGQMEAADPSNFGAHPSRVDLDARIIE